MPFFQALGKLLSGGSKLDEAGRQKLVDAWHVYDERPPDLPGFPEPEVENARSGLLYDRSIWYRKLKRILSELPNSESEWPELKAEVASLGLDSEWVAGCVKAEFTMIVRRALADGVISSEEHRRIDQARRLVGLSDEESIAILNEIKTEAEEVFGARLKKSNNG